MDLLGYLRGTPDKPLFEIHEARIHGAPMPVALMTGDAYELTHKVTLSPTWVETLEDVEPSSCVKRENPTV